MFNFDGDERDIGFVFDATFDPELGIGVLVTNSLVSTVDVRDFARLKLVDKYFLLKDISRVSGLYFARTDCYVFPMEESIHVS